MRTNVISSLQNPAIKSLVRLRKKRERYISGLILIEGTRELYSALKSGVVVEDIFICPSLAGNEEREKLSTELGRRNIRQTEVTPQVFEKITYRGSSSYLTAIARKKRHDLGDLEPGDLPFYLVVDSVEKPGNLGAIFRSADGAGTTGVLISDPVTDLGNPNVIRASLGTVFSLPSAVSPADNIIAWLKKNNISIIATTPLGKLSYTDADLTGSSAIVVGSEDKGLGKKWIEACDLEIMLPMLGTADSLNVSAAASIVLYEALRQRTRA
ncbi:MAG: RNA methyltransferase [Candidatus Krumholzibacteriota bacterium]|nr:RNA methyltransferase [Candidatus Krumholzibacteriota bacterium]